MANPSHLEIFPDELFLDLFSYIPAMELYHTWYGLNRRINAIIRSVHISFDLTENTNDHIDALNYFSKQIIYIHLHVCYKSFDFRQFPNVHSLIIDTKLTNEQLNSLQPHILPNLKRLSFSEWWKFEEPLNDIIFNRTSSWLKVYHLPSLPNYFLTNPLTLCSINTMIYDRLTPFDIDIVLSLQTTLRRLKVTIVRWTPDDKISKVPPYQHKTLIDLDITMNTCNKLEQLYPILSHLPSLKYLHLACDSLTINDFKRLSTELNTYLPSLQRFSCSFKQTYIDDMRQLHSMNPLFRHMKCIKVEWSGGWYYYRVTTENV